MTPEQRRFLGTPRTRDEQAEREAQLREAAEALRTELERQKADPSLPSNEEVKTVPRREEESEDEGEDGDSRNDEPASERRSASSAVAIGIDQKVSRQREMQTPLVILGALVLLFGTFYLGKKFDYLRHALQKSRPAPGEPGSAEDKFPGFSADELVVQALLNEKAGKRQEAAERLLAAKHKNLGYRGILFHVGKMAYDAGDFEGADKLFERAVAFGEDPATANYFRGLIAIRHKDLPAAQRSFEAAAAADPFTAQYHYYVAETLRLDHHPREAIVRYERARLLSLNDQDATVTEFKIRMALLEAGDAPKVAAEIEQKRSVGDLPVDWLMTAAALNIRQGQVDDALPLIAQARAAEEPGLVLSCLEDFFFVDAAAKNPAVAAACRESTEVIPAP